MHGERKTKSINNLRVLTICFLSAKQTISVGNKICMYSVNFVESKSKSKSKKKKKKRKKLDGSNKMF
jgi:hypothetical protein